MSEQPPPTDWENIRVRRSLPPTRDDSAANGLWLAITLFAVGAIAYPWYAHWVNSYLLDREAKALMEQLQQQADVASQRMQAAQETVLINAQRVQADTIRNAAARRIAAVRVMGASANASNPVVIVALGDAPLEKSTSTICAQSARWLGSSASGKRLRVQTWRGNQPAMTIGSIDCP